MYYLQPQLPQQARLAQSVERTTLNRVVVGSSPTSGEYLFLVSVVGSTTNPLSNDLVP
jgi:hypothetical protein